MTIENPSQWTGTLVPAEEQDSSILIDLSKSLLLRDAEPDCVPIFPARMGSSNLFNYSIIIRISAKAQRHQTHVAEEVKIRKDPYYLN